MLFLNIYKVLALFFVCVYILQIARADLVETLLQNKNPTSAFLENQLQAAVLEQQTYANRLIRGGVYQIEKAGKQLQTSYIIQSSATNVLAAKGLNDVIENSRKNLFIHMFRAYSI